MRVRPHIIRDVIDLILRMIQGEQLPDMRLRIMTELDVRQAADVRCLFPSGFRGLYIRAFI